MQKVSDLAMLCHDNNLTLQRDNELIVDLRPNKKSHSPITITGEEVERISCLVPSTFWGGVDNNHANIKLVQLAILLLFTVYEAGKAVKSGVPSQYAPTLYAPSMYAQPPYVGGMNQPGMPLLPMPSHPNGYGRDYDATSSGKKCLQEKHYFY